TLWLGQTEQTWELEVFLGEKRYVYRLVVDSYGDPERPRIASETVTLNGSIIFRFEEGLVRLFDEHVREKFSYPSDWHRSALAISGQRVDKNLVSFKKWFDFLLCFRLNPFKMANRAEKEAARPNYDLSNFPEWYKHLYLSAPRENSQLMQSLAGALDGFS